MLSLLVLFTLIAVTFVLVASQSRRVVRADSRHEQYGDDPRKLLDSALATLKGRPRPGRGMWNRRALEYGAKINSGDPVSIAEVVRDLHRNAMQPDPSYSERRIYETALDRLARELASVERIALEAAMQKVVRILNSASRASASADAAAA